MSEVRIIENPVKGKIATVYGQIPIIVSGDEEPVIQEAIIHSNGIYTVPAGIDGFNPITVDVATVPMLQGSFTPTSDNNSITLETEYQCSHIIIAMRVRQYSKSNAVVGQLLFNNQICSEIVNPYQASTTSDTCSVTYSTNSLTVTNNTGIYASNVLYDWWAW